MQLISPEEFPLNHVRNLTRENKVTTSAAVEVQGSLCCYFFSQGHMWLTALTGKASSAGYKVYWNPQLFIVPLLHFCSFNTLVCISKAFFRYISLLNLSTFSFSPIIVPLPLHVSSFPLRISALLWWFQNAIRVFSSLSKIKNVSNVISIWEAQAVRNIKYPEVRTLRWTTGRRREEYEKVNNIKKAICFFSLSSVAQI